MKKTPGRTTAEKVKCWTFHIEAARKYPDGVTAYCRDRGLTKNNYYQWFHRLRPLHPESENLNDTSSGTKPSQNRSTETSAKSTRRVFSRPYRARIVKEYDSLALGILKTLSRPRVSNDNAFVESLFKTLKYRHV